MIRLCRSGTPVLGKRNDWDVRRSVSSVVQPHLHHQWRGCKDRLEYEYRDPASEARRDGGSCQKDVKRKTKKVTTRPGFRSVSLLCSTLSGKWRALSPSRSLFFFRGKKWGKCYKGPAPGLSLPRRRSNHTFFWLPHHHCTHHVRTSENDLLYGRRVALDIRRLYSAAALQAALES